MHLSMSHKEEKTQQLLIKMWTVLKGDKISFNEINVTKAPEHSICASDKVYGIQAVQKHGQGC